MKLKQYKTKVLKEFEEEYKEGLESYSPYSFDEIQSFLTKAIEEAYQEGQKFMLMKEIREIDELKKVLNNRR